MCLACYVPTVLFNQKQKQVKTKTSLPLFSQPVPIHCWKWGKQGSQHGKALSSAAGTGVKEVDTVEKVGASTSVGSRGKKDLYMHPLGETESP